MAMTVTEITHSAKSVVDIMRLEGFLNGIAQDRGGLGE